MDDPSAATPDGPRGELNLKRLVLLLVVVALAIGGYSLWGRRAAPGGPQPDPAAPLEEAEHHIVVPDDVGPADAPVTVEVLVDSRGKCTCYGDTALLVLAVSELADPRLRFDFRDTLELDNRWRLKELGGSPDSVAVAIDGRSKFDLPDLEAGRPEKRREVNFMAGYSWSLGDLWSALDEVLKEKTGKGMKLGFTDYNRQVTANLERLRQEGQVLGPERAEH